MNTYVMFPRASGVLGIVVSIIMAIGAIYVLVTETFGGYAGTNAILVCLFLVVLGGFELGVILKHGRVSTPYW